ncbi:MAG TPA: YwiC-like family protein [Blastocatellia bacterium]|nr:YwiC-like family protein [Blastocatellia bacterium]
MKTRTNFRLPKEHGAWAMLYVPMIVGLLVAAKFPLRAIALAAAATFLFIARESLLVWWRGRSRGQKQESARRAMLIYLALAALFAAPLVLINHLYWLVPAAALSLALLAINAEQAVRREDRTITGEMIAIAGLTMTAPMAYYAARGSWDMTAAWLWALCALYFASSVFYVKLRVYSLSARKEELRRQTWRRCAFYHGSLLVGLLLLALTGKLNLFAIAAFAPIFGRTFWFMTRPANQINLKRIGLLEIIFSVVFLVFITLTFRIG